MKKLNNTQKALKRMIRDTESKITDEELFLSSAFQKYQTSLAKAATGRSRYGLQVLMEWDSSENADIAYTDNYRIHCNAANSITQSFPSRFLRSQSLTGLTGHEIGHLRYSDFASLQLYLTNMENGSFYPEAPDNLPSGYKANLQDILDAMEEKDNATCLTLSRCAAQYNNILEDIYIEARMCEEYPGTFKQGIQINNLRMSELIPSIQEQIDCGYQPFSIMSNLILSYCRTGNINNRTNYSGEYTDTLSDCMDYIDDALIATQGKERLRASNYLLVLCWNYIQPMVELTRESLKKQDSTQVGDALEDLLRKESGSGSPLPTGKNGGIPKNIPGPTVKSKTPITCDLSGLDPNYRQDAINQAEKVLQEEGGRIELAKTTAVLDGNNPGITYASQYAGSGYENAANDLARILNDVATEKAQNDYEQELTEDLQKSADEIHYGNAHAGIHVTIHRINPVSDFFIKSYQTVASPLLRTSKRLQSSILPLLKEEAEGGKQKNLLFGKRLDMRALHRKDGGIFTRTRLPDEEQKLSVGLLVDESGSMGWGDRITHARKTAIVLYDFCMSLGIPITIYGHSTDSKGVALYSYAEFDSLDASDRYRLMDMSARNGNRDGAALRYVAEHLAKRPESQKLLIIISDGQPADCGYSGTEAEADLRGIKNEYRKRGIVIFAAAIGDDKENISGWFFRYYQIRRFTQKYDTACKTIFEIERRKTYMSENYQNSITDQICKVQTSKKLIALYDRLRYTSYNSYAQLHAKGEFEENGHKVHSLIGISIQDYSSGTGDKNIITRFHLAPEQIQFLLSRVTAGFPEFEWSQSKIFGVPDGNGYSTAQQFFISRHVYNNQQEILTSPWRIQINNGKGIKKKNHNGGTYMQAQSFISEKSAFIQLTDMDFYMLLKRADSYIVNWEAYVASFLIQNGKQQLKKQQEARMAQNIQPQPDEMTSYMQGQPQEQYLNGMYVA